jgi:hypothetical protein
MAQLRAVFAHFPRERLLLLQFERCMREPAAQLRRTYEFLGLDPSFAPGDQMQRVNAGGTIDLDDGLIADVGRALGPDAEELARTFPEIDLSLWPGVYPKS